MCNPASMILTKGHKAHWSKTTDKHEDIIAEFGLHADGVTGANIVRIELTPSNLDWSVSLDQWNYVVDQDTRPKWYDAEEGEQAARLALIEWTNAKLVRNGETRNEVKDGENVLYVLGNGQVGYVRDNGKVGEVRGNGKVGELRGNGKVGEVLDNGKVGYVRDNGQVGLVRDNGQVGVVLDNGQVSYVLDNGQVSYVLDNGQVGEVLGSAIVRFFAAFKVKLQGRFAVAIDMCGNTAVCHVGTDTPRRIDTTEGR